jgi:hypothetical protein
MEFFYTAYLGNVTMNKSIEIRKEKLTDILISESGVGNSDATLI